MDLCPNCEKRMVAKGEQFCCPKCAVEYERTLETLKTRVRMCLRPSEERRKQSNDKETGNADTV